MDSPIMGHADAGDEAFKKSIRIKTVHQQAFKRIIFVNFNLI